ncbi:MAG: phosphoribosylformylglycinamidine cyclo-ligase [Symbiobacteriaceae bacterium]|nr:phosphoribosylformylglycinamidine cyclo-ligase [Symbiobacteriaceae bacterium]
MPEPQYSYADAGVSVNEGNRAVDLIKDKVRSTFGPEVLGDLGGFAGLFQLPNLHSYKQPVLVASTDGVGTKLKIAFETGILHSIGQDLVAMCVNDIVLQGALPLFFLDYFACAKVVPETVSEVIGGIAKACIEAGCALIGGETAELPGFYAEGEFDLAGFVVGIVDREAIIDGSSIAPGDVIVGIPSSGLHSNGFALVRHLITKSGLRLNEPAPWSKELSLGESLLTPTRIYARVVHDLIKQLPAHTVKGMVHITGGGFLDNIPRVLPSQTHARIKPGNWPVPPVFTWLQNSGEISPTEMFRTFNNGIALAMVFSPEGAVIAREELQKMGEASYVIGEIVSGTPGVSFDQATTRL